MVANFQDRFLEMQVVNQYDHLLIGNTSADNLAFVHYADLFYALGCNGRQNSTVLDLGCGPGYLGIEMARRIGTGSIHFFDISSEMIDKVKRNVNQRAGGNSEVSFRYTIDDAANLSHHIGKSSVDLVIARHLIQIPEDPQEIIRQAYESLKPNGKFIFTLVGYNTFNFSATGNSLFENQFFSRLTQACFQVLPYAMKKLPAEALEYIRQKNIITLDEQQLRFQNSVLQPKYNKTKMLDCLHKASVPLSNVTYLILPETHTVEFKLGYSLALGSIPLPGIWDVFPLFDNVTRYELVQNIYGVAFPEGKHTLVQTHDPVFIVTK